MLILFLTISSWRPGYYLCRSKTPDGNDVLQPCLSIEQLKQWGVKTALFPQLVSEKSDCADLKAIPLASTDFQFNAQRLVISIPQAAIDIPARGYVPPEMWDEGINAAMLNYSLSGANSGRRPEGLTERTASMPTCVRGSTLGLAPAQLHHRSRDASGQDKWDTVYTYAQRAVIPLKAQLTLGDSSSPADVFDSIPFRGGQLASDDDMLPDSLKGYAPVVRGIARTNAQLWCARMAIRSTRATSSRGVRDNRHVPDGRCRGSGCDNQRSGWKRTAFHPALRLCRCCSAKGV